jgi:hypothetical protein
MSFREGFMIAVGSNNGDYSASVKISLFIDGLTLDLAQVGGGRLWFEKPVKLPGGKGEVVLDIDGTEQRWKVAIDEMTEAAEWVRAEFVL